LLVPERRGTFAACRGVADGWDAVAEGGGLLSSRRWLEATERRYPWPVLTFLLGRCGRPSVGLYGTLVDDAGAYETYNPHRVLGGPTSVLAFDEPTARARGQIAVHLPETERWFPCLVLTYPGYGCFPVGPGAAEPDLVSRCLDGVLDWAAGAGARAVALQFLAREEEAALGAALAAHDHLWVPLDQRADLDLTGVASLEQHVARLPAMLRHAARREMRVLRRSGVESGRLEPRRHRGDLVELRCALLAQRGQRPDPAVEARRLDAILDAFGDDVRVFGCFQGGELVRCGSFLVHGSEWTAFWTGARYDHPATALTYFEAIFYRPIAEAVREGVSSICYGMGSSEAKRRRGARLTPVGAAILPVAAELRCWLAGCGGPLVRRAR
jgi:hypothetical protein